MMRLVAWPGGWTTRFQTSWASECDSPSQRWVKGATTLRPQAGGSLPGSGRAGTSCRPLHTARASQTYRISALLLCVSLCSIALAARATDAEPASSISAPGPAVPAASQPGSAAKRQLAEEELKDLLTRALNQQVGSEGGEWELRFTRPWTPVNVPDGDLSVQIVEPAAHRISSSAILRFELRAGKEVVGTWQAPVQAHLWREVYVARSALARGVCLAEADLARERRDVLSVHETLSGLPANPGAYELAETVPVAGVLTTRSFHLKPVVFRGQMAEALVHQGALSISLKVEVLEEGAPGQMIRVRNPQSRRELRGKVQDERTIAILL